jgi:hypothetical protein
MESTIAHWNIEILLFIFSLDLMDACIAAGFVIVSHLITRDIVHLVHLSAPSRHLEASDVVLFHLD